MAYVSLYRKYRPQKFEDVIGQTHIVRTLRNQITNDGVSHAYLFTGTRGTGKTSCAKIFAKAVNCSSPVYGSPCGQCETCRAIASGSTFDVLEIDAASNNGVDEIRDLRDMVKYPPALCRKKVFIIDEAHMLSTPAFNALLKTLEEPPEYAVFILATTEVHKLPATILSRCMRFDFRLVTNAELADRLSRIFADVGRRAEKEAIAAIAEAGEGSVRDALSIADMCLSYTDGVITQNDVLEILGASSPAFTAKLCLKILDGDAAGALRDISDLADRGKNVALTASDTAKTLRNVLFVKLCADAKETLGISEEVFSILSDAAGRHSLERIRYALDVMSGVEQKLRLSSQPRIALEAAAVKACADPIASAAELTARIAALEKRLAGGVTPLKAQTAGADSVKTMGLLIKRLREKKYLAVYAAASADTTKAEVVNGVFKITAGKKSDFDVLSEKTNYGVISEILRDLGAERSEVVFVELKSADTAADVGVITSMFDASITTVKK